jgi:hypothetical protein
MVWSLGLGFGNLRHGMLTLRFYSQVRRFLMSLVGFSTGALARANFDQALVELERKPVNSVELSALRVPELAAFVRIYSAASNSALSVRVVACAKSI